MTSEDANDCYGKMYDGMKNLVDYCSDCSQPFECQHVIDVITNEYYETCDFDGLLMSDGLMNSVKSILPTIPAECSNAFFSKSFSKVTLSNFRVCVCVFVLRGKWERLQQN